MKLDIYDVQKNFDRVTEIIKKGKGLTKRNLDLLNEFQRDCILANMSKICIIKYMRFLLRISAALKKDFDKVTKEDIQKYLQKIQEMNYRPTTKIAYKITLKKFYKWLKGNNIKYPEEVAWINTSIKRTERKLPGEGDLLTEEEIQKLIQVAVHPRDKAFVSVLYESGCRIGELCSLKIKDVNFDDKGAVIYVSGKTGSRAIRLISSVSFLSLWINNHPSKDDREGYLWVCLRRFKYKKPLFHMGVYDLLRRLFKRAEINKKYHPHLFRHSRATFLANYLTEFQMNQYFGWVQGSSMPSTYVHLSGKNIDNAILELNGIITDKTKKKESSLNPKKCPRCDTMNSFNSKYCIKCACILDIKTAMELDKLHREEKEDRKIEHELFNDFIKKREFWELFIKKAGEMGFVNKLIKP